MILRFLIALFVLAPWLAQAQLESTSDLQRGLVGWWRFNEGTGTNAFDLSGNANTGTLSGSTLPVWTNGVFGGALWFNGTTAYVSTTFGSSLGDFTACAWVYSTGSSSVNSDRIIDKNYLSGFDVNRVSNTTNLYAGMVENTSVGNIALTPNAWHHICLTRAGTKACIYGDGGKVSVLNVTVSNALTVVQNLLIGAYSSTIALHKGNIDDVRIYSRALSATEVLNLYCQGGGRTP